MLEKRQASTRKKVSRKSLQNKLAHHVIDKYNQKKVANPKQIKRRITSQYKSIENFERFHHRRVMSAIDDRFVLNSTKKHLLNNNDQIQTISDFMRDRAIKFQQLDNELKNVLKMPNNKIINRGGKLAVLISPSVVEKVTKISQNVLKKNEKVFKSKSISNLTLKDGYLKLGNLNHISNFKQTPKPNLNIETIPYSPKSSILGEIMEHRIQAQTTKSCQRKPRRKIRVKKSNEFLLSTKMMKITKYLEKYSAARDD
ncbi:unnamed protein product [Moneuplotes crassus]|uniref:Uncharacterized protein n=1 Tax=Euplotes crassus TaxID=5936 RepID=A0AAD2D0U6_EUPCR|nr:unnamed protein product [Moneuplotes crassus]